MSTRPLSGASFALTHQFKAREARDHFKELMDRAENGGVAVLRRNSTMVLVDRVLMYAGERDELRRTVFGDE